MGTISKKVCITGLAVLSWSHRLFYFVVVVVFWNVIYRSGHYPWRIDNINNIQRRGSWKSDVSLCHWTELDSTSWSKWKLYELLLGIIVENEDGCCETTELKQVEGTSSCSSLKIKLLFFYEWNSKLVWKSTIKESSVKHKGLIEIPSLSEKKLKR